MGPRKLIYGEVVLLQHLGTGKVSFERPEGWRVLLLEVPLYLVLHRPLCNLGCVGVSLTSL